MTVRILIVEPQDILRFGLRAIFVGDPSVSEIYEARDEAEFLSSIAKYSLDLIIVNQKMFNALSFSEVQKQNFIVLTTKPNITMLKLAYQHGARGYLSVNTSSSLLRIALSSTEDTFLIEPSLMLVMMEYAFESRATPNHSLPPLTLREREIMRLLREGYNKVSIASTLCITESTLNTHIKNIKKKKRQEIPLSISRSGQSSQL